MGPQYPHYPPQPYTGTLPSMKAVGPSDLRYSSGTASYYQNQIDASHGRRLAGLGASVQDEKAEPGWALNELRLMQEQDDVQNDGIFDPPGGKGPEHGKNIYPDAGVFAGRFDLPGYLARERLYAPSQVIDATTGRPVVYVNGGAVSMDTAAQVAFIERGMYAPPKPVMTAEAMRRMPSKSTVNVRQNPEPIGGPGRPPQAPTQAPTLPPAAVSAPPSRWLQLGLAAAVGGAAAIVLSRMKKRKGR